jgi:hypothetical protein
MTVRTKKTKTAIANREKYVSQKYVYYSNHNFMFIVRYCIKGFCPCIGTDSLKFLHLILAFKINVNVYFTCRNQIWTLFSFHSQSLMTLKKEAKWLTNYIKDNESTNGLSKAS